MIQLEYYRNPLRLELVRHVIPLCLGVMFLATGIGYGWARTAYMNYNRVTGQPISSTPKPNINHSTGGTDKQSLSVFTDDRAGRASERGVPRETDRREVLSRVR